MDYWITTLLSHVMSSIQIMRWNPHDTLLEVQTADSIGIKNVEIPFFADAQCFLCGPSSMLQRGLIMGK